MVKRQMVRIDEALCNGCGLCVVPCAEGAIEMVDGKAKVLQEELCDGAGFCLSVCPTGALSIEVREATPFDERAVEERQGKKSISPRVVSTAVRARSKRCSYPVARRATASGYVYVVCPI